MWKCGCGVWCEWEVYLIIESITTTFHTAIGHIKSTWTNITLSRKVQHIYFTVDTFSYKYTFLILNHLFKHRFSKLTYACDIFYPGQKRLDLCENIDEAFFATSPKIGIIKVEVRTIVEDTNNNTITSLIDCEQWWATSNFF